MVFENIIDQNFPKWNETEIDGKPFDDIFKIDGVPLWWFYRRFITSHVLPKQFKLQQRLRDEKDSLFLRTRDYFVGLGFINYFYYNEKRKQKIAGNVHGNLGGGTEKVLLLTYANHYNRKTGETFRIQKLVDLVQKEEKIKPFLLYTDPLSKIFSKEIKIFNHTIYGYVTPENAQKADKEAKELSKIWKGLDKNHLFGKKWWAIRAAMNFFFSYEFIYNTALYYLTCEKIIPEQCIKAIVLTSRNGFFERCMIAGAIKLQIPTVVIQHGLGLGLFSPETPAGIKHLVFGDIFKERLKKLGVEEKDIIITGPLIFDDIMPFIGKRIVGRKIVIITAPFIEENRMKKDLYFRRISNILDLLQEFSSEIIIKMHPRERTKSDYEGLLTQKQLKNVKIVDASGSNILYSVMQDSALVINFFSTAALEAMIMDRPVLTIDPLVGFSNISEDMPYEGGEIVKIDGDIRAAVLRSLHDSEESKMRRRAMVQKFCYKVDGKASQRALKAIYGLMKS